MKISKEIITSFIPQKQPFVMIDNLLEAAMTGFESDFLVRKDNIFVENNELMEPGLIENIAQTCAAGFGFLQHEREEEPKIGFIGAITKLLVHSLPQINSLIHTNIAVIHQFENVFLVKGENFCGSNILLECEMKIVIT